MQFSEDDEGNNNDGTRSFIQPSESARKAVSSSKSKSKHHSNQGRPSQIQTSRSKKQQIRAPDSASDASDSEQGRVPLSDTSNFGTMGPQRASKRKTPSTVLEPNATAKAAKRMTKSQYEKEIQALKAELLTKDATIKTSVSELAQSDKKNEQLKFRIKTSGSDDGPALVPNSGTKLMVEKLVKSDLFQVQKFLANDTQLLIACIFIAKRTSEYTEEWKDKPVEEQKKWFKKFAACYGTIVTHQLNDQRSYVQQNLKKLYFDLWEKGKTAPTSKQLLCIALRRDLLDVRAVEAVEAEETVEETETEEAIEAVEAKDAVAAVDNSFNKLIFEWYWVEILGKVAGNLYWGPNQKFYGRISTSMPVGETAFKCIPSCTEAAAVLVVENCWLRWKYLWKCKQEKVKPDKKHKHFKPLYSDSCSGQQKFGGWKPEGRIRFKKLKVRIGKARRAGHVEKVEKVCLASIRDKYGIAAKDAKTKSKKTKDPEKAAAAKALAAAEIDFGSDDEETASPMRRRRRTMANTRRKEQNRRKIRRKIRRKRRSKTS